MNPYFSGIELDVRLTKDKQVVVIHDALINRTSNKSGFVKDYTVKELKKMDFGSWFGKQFKKVRIPTLEETLRLVRKKKTLYVELKDTNMEEEVYQVLKKKNYFEKIYLQSFKKDVMKKLHHIDPNLKLGLLDFRLNRNEKTYQELPIDYVGLNYQLNFKDELIKYARNHKLLVWTVNKEEDKQYIQTHFGDTDVVTNTMPEKRRKLWKKKKS